MTVTTCSHPLFSLLVHKMAVSIGSNTGEMEVDHCRLQQQIILRWCAYYAQESCWCNLQRNQSSCIGSKGVVVVNDMIDKSSMCSRPVVPSLTHVHDDTCQLETIVGFLLHKNGGS